MWDYLYVCLIVSSLLHYLSVCLKYAYLHKQITAMAGINRVQYKMHFYVKIYDDARSRFVYDIQVNVTIKELQC